MSSRERYSSLLDFPDELLHIVIGHLHDHAVAQFSLSSKKCYALATPRLWRDVELVDQWKLHLEGGLQLAQSHRGLGDCDEHDDTPIIRKLVTLASNPFVASNVQSLIHRCHIPTPGIFTELPIVNFKNETLSVDARTTRLVYLATRNLTNLQTLRIVHGHWNISVPLLEGLLHRSRVKAVPLARIWLENTSIEGFDRMMLSDLDATGLKSIRFRRMSLHPTGSLNPIEYSLSRGSHLRRVPNGRAGYDMTSILQSHMNQDIIQTSAESYEHQIYNDVAEAESVAQIDVPFQDQPPWTRTETPQPEAVMKQLLGSAASTLTSLNLDWILLGMNTRQNLSRVVPIAELLCSLHFPNLRAFQFRNAVTTHTKLPSDIILLEPVDLSRPNFLQFLELHPNLTCLAWPMDLFFSQSPSIPDVRERGRSVIVNLGRTLVELRVDAHYSGIGEPLTDRSVQKQGGCMRRRRFISEFAKYMTRLKVIKMEGGIPRDEKREALRAIRACPLEKIVFIGVSCPIGNAWGENGTLLRQIDENAPDFGSQMLEDEDDFLVKRAAVAAPEGPPKEETFWANYGPDPSSPLVNVIASRFASTITELKFCGFNGCTILRKPTEISDYLLYPLRHFHGLKKLVLSMWLLTYFDNFLRDSEIVKYWIDARESTSTALVPVDQDPPAAARENPDPQPAGEQMEGIEESNGTSQDESRRIREFMERTYSPRALAEQVNAQVSVHLSATALARPSPLCVRASFCLGESTTDIFDLEVWLRGGGVGDGAPGAKGRLAEIVDWMGPCEESESRRQVKKLLMRRWF